MHIINFTKETKMSSITDVLPGEMVFIVCQRRDFAAVKQQLHLDSMSQSEAVVKRKGVTFESGADFDLINLVQFRWRRTLFEFEKLRIYRSQHFIVLETQNDGYLYEELLAWLARDSFQEQTLMDSISFAYCQVFEFLLDQMFEALFSFEDELEEMEVSILENRYNKFSFERLIALKRQAFRVRRYLRSTLYVGDELLVDENNFIETVNRKYFTNIDTKINRLSEYSADLYEKSEGLLDIYDIIMSQRSNNFLNKLTILTAVATPLTVISGIYGMNFVNMPELKHPYGYFIVLAIMLVSVVLTLLVLKWKKHL
ncbi:CorA family divalent cation transporter [Vagococcus acidifermentans]|uniref:Magnesium transporter n=1 Tax=Vagococcus acidifermentans TaxID=564710 RepID=A0A430AWM3_9ENTE|nr:CorA family divalent cation transporter [Vagococcus acidifermentans]RSU12436.1 hypothetical protein CBF27_05525 [Vagococcus acidifermentans]